VSFYFWTPRHKRERFRITDKGKSAIAQINRAFKAPVERFPCSKVNSLPTCLGRKAHLCPLFLKLCKLSSRS
tara:strand:- start:12 stop:227 length:216 start_codon:yes stop_codon:yes gene_type:complete